MIDLYNTKNVLRSMSFYPVFKEQVMKVHSNEPSKLNAKRQVEENFLFIPLNILRKEVIHPHLPIRLPCYDFTPIICPTFGGWLPNGLPHRLRVLQTLVV